jgi:hypothetical protein
VKSSQHNLGLCMFLCVYLVLVTGSPCKQIQKLLPPGKYRPVLTLLPDDGPIFIPYGTPAAFNPGPCSSGNTTAACAVVAWDVQASSGKRTDVTRAITVSQTLDCGSSTQVSFKQLEWRQAMHFKQSCSTNPACTVRLQSLQYCKTAVTEFHGDN